ncbi:hypothetical protein CCUS01_16611, partial [Colletotrichum cuscutae]
QTKHLPRPETKPTNSHTHLRHPPRDRSPRSATSRVSRLIKATGNVRHSQGQRLPPPLRDLDSVPRSVTLLAPRTRRGADKPTRPEPLPGAAVSLLSHAETLDTWGVPITPPKLLQRSNRPDTDRTTHHYSTRLKGPRGRWTSGTPG